MPAAPFSSTKVRLLLAVPVPLVRVSSSAMATFVSLRGMISSEQSSGPLKSKLSERHHSTERISEDSSKASTLPRNEPISRISFRWAPHDRPEPAKTISGGVASTLVQFDEARGEVSPTELVASTEAQMSSPCCVVRSRSTAACVMCAPPTTRIGERSQSRGALPKHAE